MMKQRLHLLTGGMMALLMLYLQSCTDPKTELWRKSYNVHTSTIIVITYSPYASGNSYNTDKMSEDRLQNHHFYADGTYRFYDQIPTKDNTPSHHIIDEHFHWKIDGDSIIISDMESNRIWDVYHILYTNNQYILFSTKGTHGYTKSVLKIDSVRSANPT